MQLFLIRHAESENNARPDYQRVEDPGLTALGRQQAGHLGTWTSTLSMDHLICSPFRRTLQTLQVALGAGSIGQPPTVNIWHDVFERGGCYRGHGPQATEGGIGLNRQRILEYFPDAEVDSCIGDAGWWNGRPRETDDECRTRAAAVKMRLENTFGTRQENVVIMLHAEFKRFLLDEILSPGIDAFRLGSLRNTSVSKLDFTDQGWQLDWLNSVSHLPAGLVTRGKG